MSEPRCPSCGREMPYKPFVLSGKSYVRSLNVCQSCRIRSSNKRKAKERADARRER